MLGKLTWQAIPFDQPIPLYSAAVVGAMAAGATAAGPISGIIGNLNSKNRDNAGKDAARGRGGSVD